jgi:hypothetical protein
MATSQASITRIAIVFVVVTQQMQHTVNHHVRPVASSAMPCSRALRLRWAHTPPDRRGWALPAISGISPAGNDSTLVAVFIAPLSIQFAASAALTIRKDTCTGGTVRLRSLPACAA